MFNLSPLFYNLFFCRDLSQDELRRYNHWTVVCAYVEHVAEIFERSIDMELSQHLFIGNDISSIHLLVMQYIPVHTCT